MSFLLSGVGVVYPGKGGKNRKKRKKKKGSGPGLSPHPLGSPGAVFLKLWGSIQTADEGSYEAWGGGKKRGRGGGKAPADAADQALRLDLTNTNSKCWD